MLAFVFCLFFFSSRRRHTRWTGDWSSDVCSSDLGSVAGYAQVFGTQPSDRIRLEGSTFGAVRIIGDALPPPATACARAGISTVTNARSEERRVGKECGSWWVAWH